MNDEIEVPGDELEQWDLAARLLEIHGAGIADFIHRQMRICLQNNDSEQGGRWRTIIDKVAALIDADGGKAN